MWTAKQIDSIPAFGVIPGAGSAGLVWENAAARLNGTLLLAPDEDRVPDMADALAPQVEALPRPRALVGSSLGAVIAVEVARTVTVDALVLIAAGPGIRVGRRVLDRVAADPPGLFVELARATVADPHNDNLVDIVARDFALRGQPVLMRHLRALAAHRPLPLPEPPPALVIWGMRDPGVPLEEHVDLAIRCQAPLVPIADAGHLPYLERPEETIGWIQRFANWAAGPSPAAALPVAAKP